MIEAAIITFTGTVLILCLFLPKEPPRRRTPTHRQTRHYGRDSSAFHAKAPQLDCAPFEAQVALNHLEDSKSA